MPTNLPPEYAKIEERYRAAKSVEERISCLEEMLTVIPKHKGTDRLRADLRRKLSKMKDASQTKKGAAKRTSVFQIDKEGAGQVAVVGLPNVGKSALLVALTNASPEVADYPFTTWTPTPGMMLVENVQIQLIDTPPLNTDHMEPDLLSLIRRADVVLLVVDLQTFPIQQLEDSLAILQEHRIFPNHAEIPEADRHRMVSKPFIVVANKCDDERLDEDCEVLGELIGEEWHVVPVSATTGRNLDRLRWAVFDRLEIVRVYSKPPGKEPDRTAPFVLAKGSTVEEFAAGVHQDFVETLTSARIWGTGVYDGQQVGRDHVLSDGDVVELRT